MSDTKRYWDIRASTWSTISEPLRLSDAELLHYEMMVSQYSKSTSRNCLILGATEKLFDLFGQSCNITCIDISNKMIELIDRTKHSSITTINGDWLQRYDQHIPDGTLTHVVGDGIFSLLTWSSEYIQLLYNAYVMLRKNGLFIVRLFVPGANPFNPYANADEHRFRTMMHMAIIENEYNVPIHFEDCIVTYSFPPLNSFLELASRQFKIENILFPTDTGYNDHYVTVCLRKK